MQNVQRGTYLGFLSQEEVNFLKKKQANIRAFVKTPYTKEQIQRIEALILETFPEIASPQIVQAIKDNVVFIDKNRNLKKV